ncbi:MAG TPA: GNAT family N-acetyltransferase [Candidatus Limnocylindrales bacterium]|nr:GNAT family N-acetyltransferase [Candidatus Limnocylindrales bacterium]
MSDVPAPIATHRLRLEPLRVEDADEMAGVLADPALYVFTGGEPPSVETLRARYAIQVTGGPPSGDERWRNWVLRLREDGTAIGYVQATLTLGGTHADLGWVLGAPWQGAGYATEASNAVLHRLIDEGVRVVTAHVRADHAASAAVAQRIGLLATDDVEDGEQVWRLDIGAREAAKRRRTIRLNLAVGIALIGFALFEAVMARTGQLPRSADQLVRDLLLACAGAAMLGYGTLAWVRGRRAARPGGGPA